MNAFRKAILDDIYDRVDSPEELDTLKESVANGTALKIVQRTGGKLTDDDIDAIISGVDVEEDDTTDVGTSGTPSFRDRSDDIVSATPEPVTPEPVNTEPVNTEPVTTAVDPESADTAKNVARMLEEGADEEPEAVNETGAAATAQLNIDNAEKRAASVADITYSDWKKLSRQERKDKGYPVRNIDGVYTDPDAWKPEPEDTSGESKPTLNTTSFVEKYGTEISAFINENETDVTDKEDIKSTLAAWFSDNADNPEVSGTMSVDELTELVYKALN
jgi:hypothetical protein